MPQNTKEIKQKDNASPNNWGQPDIAVEEPIKENHEKESLNQKGKSQDLSFTKITPSQPDSKVKPSQNSFNVQLQPKVVTPKMSPTPKETNTSKTEKENKKEKEEDKLEEKVVGEKTADFATPPKDDDKEKSKSEEKKQETEAKDQKGKKEKDIKNKPQEHKGKTKGVEKEKTELDKKAAPKENPLEGQEIESKSAKQEAAEVEAPAIDSSSSGSVITSLASANPTNFAQGMQIADSAVSKAKQTEKKKAEESLPIIEQPTGLNDTDKLTEKATIPPEGKSPEIGIKESGQPDIIDTKVTLPSTPVPSEKIKSASLNEPWSPEHFAFRINQFPTTDESLETSPGEKPPVDLSGEASPEQNSSNLKESDSEVEKQKEESDKATLQDFGENNMYPNIKKETLKSQYTFSETEGWQSEKETLPQISADTKLALDQKIKEAKGGEIEAEVIKQKAGESDYSSKVENEKKSGLEKIDEETKKTRETQLEEQKKGKDQVNDERENWKEENKKIKQEFSDKSEVEKSKVEKDIDSKVKETDQKVDQEYSSAEKKSVEEEDKAKQDVEDKKKEAKEKEKEKSWWDKVTDAISDFFNALKKAVSAIFDVLRKAVKVIIEAAKTLVKGLIELARKFVVGLIKAFAEVLKGFVKLALAAFPKLAEKICKAIDKAVEKTVNVINKLAEGLKKVCDFILDSIGKAIDFVLSVYEKIINAILDVLEFITVGIIKIMKGIANLVSAATDMGDHFMGQLSEELLGQDATKPLQNERPAIPAISEGASVISQVAEDMEQKGAIDESESALINKSEYSENDFDVPVANNPELSDELQESIAEKGDGEYEFGEEYGDPSGIEKIKSEIIGSPTENQEETTTTSDSTSQAQESTTPISQPVDIYEPGPDGLVGPFTPMQRAWYTAKQMGKAVKEWFAKNWPIILIAVIAGILGLILANIVTGGAVMAALPLLLQLVSVYFAAEAIVKMGAYFGKYLGAAWPGEIVIGAKNFARAIAIGAIELVFALLFGGKAVVKGVKAGVKAAAKGGVKGLAKTTAKAVKTSAKGMVKANIKAVKQLGKVAKKGFQNTIKNGKFVLEGIKSVATKGAKSLDDLAKFMGKKLRFKKFKLQIKGLRFRLFGLINPYILLADGTIKKVKQKDLGGKKAGRLGDEVLYKGQKAFVIGEKTTKGSTSTVVKDLKKLKKTDRKLYGELKKLRSKKKRYKHITDNYGVPRNPKFRSNYFEFLEKQGIKLSEEAKQLINVHHKIPNFLKGSKEAKGFLKDMKYNIDELQNAIGLPTVDVKSLRQSIEKLEELKKLKSLSSADEALKAAKESKVQEALAFIKEKHGLNLNIDELDKILKELKTFESSSVHAGYHTAYSTKVEKMITGFATQYKTASPQLKALIEADFKKYIDNLTDSLKNGTIDLP
ncbi:MAG: hypothetical protein EHM93_07505 [Bacteroidales bacterium]|nr:MAG: hypothetical protein EHM93_07505 [Bacteroidales bacterium]